MFTETVTTTPQTTPDVAVTPKAVERMIAARQEFQVMKFRTTCTDCVPNF